MQFLEISLLCAALFFPFFFSIEQVKRNRKSILIAFIILFMAHVIFEGLRWQMIPIYVFYHSGIVLLSLGYSFFKGTWFRKIISGFLLIFMLAIGTFLSISLPVFDFPKPQGEYAVGADYIHFVSDRDEVITEEEGDKRAFMIKVWYPAEIKDESAESYLDEAGRQGFALKYNLPRRTFSYLDHIKINTFVTPQPANGTFPVLIFSHGYYSNAFGYYALIEEVVSQGFIVLNINHTYESVGAKFPSGELKFYDKAYDSKHNNEEMAKMAWEGTEGFRAATSMEQKKEAIDYLLKNYFAAKVSERWEKDIHDVVSQIPTWSQTTFLADHIDTSKIGVVGHSQGGAAAGQALIDNPKIVAGVNLDGVQWGKMIDTSLHKPFLLLSSDWPDDHPDFNEVAYQQTSSPDFYIAKIKNSGHSNFMDLPLLINIPLLNESGDIDHAQGIRIASDLVVKFFNKYLKKLDTEFESLTKFYPELELKRKSNDH